MVATIKVGGNPDGVGITPDGGKVYVANQLDNTVTVIDAAANAVIGSPIAVGRAPLGLAITPDGSRAYVANYYSNTVSVIDTATDAVIGSRIPVGVSPAAFGPFIQPTVKFAGTPGLENCVRQSIKTLERRYGSLDATAKVLGYDGPPALRKAIRRYCG